MPVNMRQTIFRSNTKYYILPPERPRRITFRLRRIVHLYDLPNPPQSFSTFLNLSRFFSIFLNFSKIFSIFLNETCKSPRKLSTKPDFQTRTYPCLQSHHSYRATGNSHLTKTSHGLILLPTVATNLQLDRPLY